MVRRILAVVAGLAVAVVIIMLVQKLGHTLYPPPADLDPADQEFMREYVANLPWGPLAFVIGSYVLSTLAGGWLAATIAGEHSLVFAGIVAVAVLAGILSTVSMIPHPPWFTEIAVTGVIVAALAAAAAASNMGGKRKAF